MKFQVECNDKTFDNFSLNMGGVYNVMNAVVSVSVANLLECRFFQRLLME